MVAVGKSEEGAGRGQWNLGLGNTKTGMSRVGGEFICYRPASLNLFRLEEPLK